MEGMSVARCGFCGEADGPRRRLFSGRPRARALGTNTPFACGVCAEGAQASLGDGECTFCGRKGSIHLRRGRLRMCGSCVDFCGALST